jgi:hypothetical protein
MRSLLENSGRCLQRNSPNSFARGEHRPLSMAADRWSKRAIDSPAGGSRTLAPVEIARRAGEPRPKDTARRAAPERHRAASLAISNVVVDGNRTRTVGA